MDIALVKRDVVPFIKNPTQLDIWSIDYFFAIGGNDQGKIEIG